MTRVQNFHSSAWTYQALNLFLYIFLVPVTSDSVLEEVCLRAEGNCSCSSPPIQPPGCPLFKRAVIECPDDMTVRTEFVPYNYFVTYYPSGCIVDYEVLSQAGQETITVEVRGEDCGQFMFLRNSTCSPFPGFQFRESTTVTTTTQVTCQAYDYCFRVTQCSFNITHVKVDTDFCEICCRVQILLIVMLALNAVGWICCLIAALMPTTSQPARSSHRGKGSKTNGDYHDDEAYVNELFQDIDSQDNPSDDTAGNTETSTTKSQTSHDHD